MNTPRFERNTRFVSFHPPYIPETKRPRQTYACMMREGKASGAARLHASLCLCDADEAAQLHRSHPVYPV